MVTSISQNEVPWLCNSWYIAGLSRDIKTSEMVRRVVFGEAIVIGRTKAGALFALKDVCPHRGAPLSAGSQVNEGGAACVTCPYHGWAFDVKTGQCANVPALSVHDDVSFKAVHVERFFVEEENGIIWIFWGDEKTRAAVRNNGLTVPPLPFPEFGLPVHSGLRSATVLDVCGSFDEAVTGLVDPAHTPYVHQQWWWRKGSEPREKVKHFTPLYAGFRMPAHEPSSNSRIYKMLGGEPTTQIDFMLPGVRIEMVKTEKYTIIGLTAITPLDKRRNQIFHLLFWDLPLLTVLKPVVDMMALSFLKQDQEILNCQSQNLQNGHHTPLYLGQPDEPAKWLHRLNRAWETQMVGPQLGAFKNPLQEAELRWKT